MLERQRDAIANELQQPRVVLGETAGLERADEHDSKQPALREQRRPEQ